MHHPLQQGLRPDDHKEASDFYCVRVHHPLQQGLRLEGSTLEQPTSFSASASSITTRIKTGDY